MSEQAVHAPVVTASFLRDVLAGKAKPRSEAEAIQASAALMWKQAFEVALRPMDGDESDPLAAPQSQAIRDVQAQWMGVEAAVTFGASIQRQLSHAQAGAPGPQPQSQGEAMPVLASMGPKAVTQSAPTVKK